MATRAACAFALASFEGYVAEGQRLLSALYAVPELERLGACRLNTDAQASSVFYEVPRSLLAVVYLLLTVFMHHCPVPTLFFGLRTTMVQHIRALSCAYEGATFKTLLNLVGKVMAQSW